MYEKIFVVLYITNVEFLMRQFKTELNILKKSSHNNKKLEPVVIALTIWQHHLYGVEFEVIHMIKINK